MKKIITVILIFSLNSCQKTKRNQEIDKLSSKEQTEKVTQEPDSVILARMLQKYKGKKLVENQGNWTYSEEEDKMTGAKTKFASVKSDNTLIFDMPYQGGSTSYLSIRKKRGQLDIYVSVRPSQMTFNYDDEIVKVRFDKGSLKSYSINKAADGSSDIFFFSNTKAVLKNIRSSKKMLVEVMFYDHGTEILEFSTSNLTLE